MVESLASEWNWIVSAVMSKVRSTDKAAYVFFLQRD
jgi:hypothetical protein